MRNGFVLVLAALFGVAGLGCASSFVDPTGQRTSLENAQREYTKLIRWGEIRRAAGYVELGRSTDLAANDHVVEVKGLAVDPVHQGRGIGRALVQAAAEEAACRGARRLTLRVLSHNDIARALYERSGFVVEGVLRGEFLIGGEYVDDVLMARALDEEEPVPPDAAVS